MCMRVIHLKLSREKSSGLPNPSSQKLASDLLGVGGRARGFSPPATPTDTSVSMSCQRAAEVWIPGNPAKTQDPTEALRGDGCWGLPQSIFVF